jgi:hypothetical protein
MPRKRDLKPSFFKNEDLGSLDPFARLLFAGLWCWADREGRLEDRPKRIKFEILPYDDVNVSKLLDLLHDNSFIIRYEVSGKKCIQIQSWKKHGNPHPQESSYDLPEPSKEIKLNKIKKREKKLNLPLDSLALNLNSLTSPSPLSPTPKSPGKPAGKQISTAETLPTPTASKDSEQAGDKTDLETIPRQGDLLSDAFVEITGSDPTIPAIASQIGRVVKMALSAKPPYTPDEILSIPQKMLENGYTISVNLGNVHTYIGWARKNPKRGNSNGRSGDGVRPNSRIGVDQTKLDLASKKTIRVETTDALPNTAQGGGVEKTDATDGPEHKPN